MSKQRYHLVGWSYDLSLTLLTNLANMATRFVSATISMLNAILKWGEEWERGHIQAKSLLSTNRSFVFLVCTKTWLENKALLCLEGNFRHSTDMVRHWYWQIHPTFLATANTHRQETDIWLDIALMQIPTHIWCKKHKKEREQMDRHMAW